MKSSIRDCLRHLLIPVFALLALIPSFVNAATVSDANGAASLPVPAIEWKPASDLFIYGIIGVIFLAALIALLMVRKGLSETKWSLADALSEEAEVTATESSGGVTRPILDTSGKPVQIREMRASASRLIALLGMIFILVMYLGFGTFVLYGFAKTGSLPASIDTIIRFLLSGLTLFAPYAVNKLAGMFENLSGGK